MRYSLFCIQSRINNRYKLIKYDLFILATCDTSKSPEETPPTTLFCSPVKGSEYKVGQPVNLSWNPYNPSLAIETEVEVYLRRKQQNTTGIEETVILNPKNSTAYLLVSIEDNSIDFIVESGWFPDYNNSIPSENSRHTFVFKVIPKGHYEYLDNPIYNSDDFIAIGMFVVLENFIYKIYFY